MSSQKSSNQDIEYDLQVIAVGNGQAYFADMNDVHHHERVALELKAISEEDLSSRLEGDSSMDKDFLVRSLDHIMFVEQDFNRKQRNNRLTLLRTAIAPTIYCSLALQ